MLKTDLETFEAYKRKIQNLKAPSLNLFTEIAQYFINNKNRHTPWLCEGLNHGTELLTSQEQLNCYLCAYQKTHQDKLNYALESFPFTNINSDFEIIDWGCGQGIGTVSLLEFLEKNNLSSKILPLLKKIILVEPSSQALERAKLHVFLKIKNNSNISIEIINDFLPIKANNIKKLKKNPATTIINIFSNILDIEAIDLKALTSQTIISKLNYYICVGPCNAGEERIDVFSNYFNLDQKDIILDKRTTQLGKYSTGRWYTAKAKVFLVNTDKTSIPLQQYSYYIPFQLHAGYALDFVFDYLKIKEHIHYHNLKQLNTFEVLAPFDIAAKVTYEIHPIYAVLSNIISRGNCTKASPYIHAEFNKILACLNKDNNLGSIHYLLKNNINISDYTDILEKTPLAIARIQKVLLEALICRKLTLTKTWKILVIENDVPCAALALKDLEQMFYHLTSLSKEYQNLKWPKIDLSIISNKHPNSLFHLNSKVYSEETNSLTQTEYDIVLDISIDEFCKADTVKFTKFKAKNGCYFNIRSSIEIYSNNRILTSNRIEYKPLVNKTTDGTYQRIEENVSHLKYFLNLIFRKIDFRDGQLPILDRAMQLKTVIGLLPTGGGKSLTYQIAGMLQPGVSLIVDPIVSLMKDQVDGLVSNGIDNSASLNSKATAEEKKEICSRMAEGKYQFIFLSPERLCIENFRTLLSSMYEAKFYFSYGIIDEVHCVSEWGHDFRFSYLHLGRNLYTYVLPKKGKTESESHISLFGLTATASFDVLADVERELSGNGAFPIDADTTVRYENTNRLELQYRVIKVEHTGNIRNKWDLYKEKNQMVPYIINNIMKSSLDELEKPEEIKKIKQRFIERENITQEKIIKKINEASLETPVNYDWYEDPSEKIGAIVFCPHRQGSLGPYDSPKNDGIVSTIKNSINCDHISCFVGGDDLTAQDEFVSNKTNIMVATKAFGMGIDKPNVRFTLNVCHSGSLEAFVQEAGRAGRDQKMALAIILYDPTQVPEKNNGNTEYCAVDVGIHKFFYNNNFKGKNFEKRVMYYMMTELDMELEEPENITSPKLTTVAGFIKSLEKCPNGATISCQFSYNSTSRSFYILNQKLIAHGLPQIGNNYGSTKEKNDQEYAAILSKTIYRMCCIGLIDDYTQDYSNKTFKIIARKKGEGEYFKELGKYLRRYYADDRVQNELNKAYIYRGQNEIQKCLGYLTDFVYEKIATKRWRAINDMEAFCSEAVTSDLNWLDTNEMLKDHLYYYFNSKFARSNYTASDGTEYSLVDDTERGKVASFDLVEKYMKVSDDKIISDGTPKENVKHLQGAVRLIRRAVTEENPALDLLNSYCLLYNKTGKNKMLHRELKDSFVNGYIEFYNRTKNKNDFYSHIENYIKTIGPDGIGIASGDDFDTLKNWVIESELQIHLKWLKSFANNFTI